MTDINPNLLIAGLIVGAGVVGMIYLNENIKTLTPPGEGQKTQKEYEELEGEVLLGQPCSRDSSCSQNMTHSGPGGGLVSRVGCVRGTCDIRNPDPLGSGMLYFDAPPCSEYSSDQINLLKQNETYNNVNYRPSSDGTRCESAASGGQKIISEQLGPKPLGAKCLINSDCSASEVYDGENGTPATGKNVQCKTNICSRVQIDTDIANPPDINNQNSNINQHSEDITKTLPLGGRCNLTSDCSSIEISGGPQATGQNVECRNNFCNRVSLL